MKSMAPKTILMIALLGTAGAAHALDGSDVYAIDQTAQNSLEYARTDESSSWINPDTGSQGTFTPVATHEGPDGEVCREYSITAIIGGREELVYGVACRQPDGHWVEANTEQPPSAPPAPANVAYPPATVVYPWWGLVTSLAFSGSYCSDGFCFGGRYGYSDPYGYSYPYGSYYPYGYYPYGFRFSYSHYDYDDHYRYRRHHRSRRDGGQRHYRSQRDGGQRHYRQSGHDRNDRRSRHHSRSRDSRDGRSKSTHSRGSRSHDGRSKSTRSRGSRSHDRRSTGSRSRGDRSRGSRVARASRNH